MATFVLFWNPDISSFKLEELREFLKVKPNYYRFNWSIWEHNKAEFDDQFVMVRCKKKPVPGKTNSYGKPLWEPYIDDTTGICIVGSFISNPYPGEDWSGKGRETYYVDLLIEQMSDPDKCVILSTKELMDAIPSFDWTGGHSGRLLDDELVVKLETMLNLAIGAKQEHIWSPTIEDYIID